MSKKRKYYSESDHSKDGEKSVCIIHWPSSNGKNFVGLMSAKDYQARFLKLQDVKQKRMNEPLGSANRLDEQQFCWSNVYKRLSS